MDSRGRSGALHGHLSAAGRDDHTFPNGLASMFFHVAERRAESDRVLTELIAPALGRPAEEARGRLMVGSAAECAEKLSRYAAAGVERMFVWPVVDIVRQLEALQGRVVPLATL